MRSSILTYGCTLACLALLTGTVLAQRGHGGSRGGSHGGGNSRPAQGSARTPAHTHTPASGALKHTPTYASAPATTRTPGVGVSSKPTTARFVARPTTRRPVRIIRAGGAAAEGGSSDSTGGVGESTAEETAPAKSSLYGVKIIGLTDGAAMRQGLRKGDIILSFNGLATPTFDALRDAVQDSGARAEVIFVNVENGERESIVLYPKDGRIGTEVEEVEVE
jgi:hypothetical protein